MQSLRSMWVILCKKWDAYENLSIVFNINEISIKAVVLL